MIDKSSVKAIAFDFGGTLDSPFLHWAEIYIEMYARQLGLPIDRENFWDSYVYAERQMEVLQLVRPYHSLYDTQLFKTRLQCESLIERGILTDDDYHRCQLPQQAARLVTDYSAGYVQAARPVLARLAESYQLLLVSNYYGNLETITTDLGIRPLFRSVTDSACVGIRKPDAAIWQLAFDRADFTSSQMLVVGDSAKNDILPALSLGCQVVQGVPASKELPADVTGIRQIADLLDLLLSNA